MGAPGNYTLKIYQGDSYSWQFTLWADVDKTDPVDLTDTTVLAQIRDKPGGTTLASLSCVVSDTNPNIIYMELDSANSDGVRKSGVWDLQITWPNTEVETILKGKVKLTNDVTKASTQS